MSIKEFACTLTAAALIITSGCSRAADMGNEAFNADSCFEVVVGELVFLIPDNAELIQTTYDVDPEKDSSIFPISDKEWSYYINDENGELQEKILISYATGSSAEDNLNFDETWSEDFRLFEDCVQEEFPSLNGIEYQSGAYWTIEGLPIRRKIIYCMIDDVYYSIWYSAAEEYYDPLFFDGFISCIRKQ